ncbi:hypothetical protein FA15DRAFT_452805 [Coprinopsis marcescibilis]|uniref:Uncharacterized protein n=1 Tax=Coprinopsis marcescibilis TaxID=230819 RepID=A0A5C3K955_COPMA|nr:hypothetical protein FA15DRAFT_452805 [Coprinopsis marcescibilis]
MVWRVALCVPLGDIAELSSRIRRPVTGLQGRMYKLPHRIPLTQQFAAILSPFPSLLHRRSLAAYSIVFILFDRVLYRRSSQNEARPLVLHARSTSESPIPHTTYLILRRRTALWVDEFQDEQMQRQDLDSVVVWTLDRRCLWRPGSVCAHARVHRLNRLPAALCAAATAPLDPPGAPRRVLRSGRYCGLAQREAIVSSCEQGSLKIARRLGRKCQFKLLNQRQQTRRCRSHRHP